MELETLATPTRSHELSEHAWHRTLSKLGIAPPQVSERIHDRKVPAMIEKRKGFPKFRLCDENIETLNGWDGSTARFRSVRVELRSRAVETEYFANLEAATFFF